MKQQYSKLTKYCSCTLFLLISILCLSGCSNDFLNNEPVYMGEFPESAYIEAQNGQVQSLTLELPEVQNAYYQIRQYPEWMEFQQMEGYLSGGITTLNFRVSPESPNNYRFQGTLLISIKGFGLVSINIVVGEPKPEPNPEPEPEPEQDGISFDKNNLNFNTDIAYFNFSILNHSANNVTWSVINCPEWVQLETRSGSISRYSSNNIHITCNRANLNPGIHTGQIEFEFNRDNGRAITKSISVSIEIFNHTNPAGLIEIEGSVADAIFCKQTDRLFIATKNPARLLVFNSIIGMQEIALSKAPNCLTLSENGKQIFVGHSGLVSCIDSALRLTKTYEVDFNVFSLAYGESNWLYLSPDAQYVSEPLIYLNLNDGFVSRIGNSNIYGGRVIFKKIKGKPLMLCTRTEISPSGVIILDISNGIPGQDKYWHEDLGKNFWFSEDYKYMYGARGSVFLSPDFNTGNDFLPLGQFERFMNSNWIDHCASANSIWCAIDNYWEDKSYINRYHDSDYYLIKSYNIDNYATTINGIFNSYRTIPQYVFSDKAGKNVFVIKNVYIIYGENIDAWSIETLTFD